MPDLPDDDASGDDALADGDREALPALEELRDAVARATREIDRLRERIDCFIDAIDAHLEA